MSESWIKEFCPNCNAANFVYLGDLEDLSRPSVEGCKCHKCQKEWLFEMVIDEFYFGDEKEAWECAWIEDGRALIQ